MKNYTVVPGDTMWSVAKKHSIGLNELLSTNPQIANSDLIFPGQNINIPITSTSTYTVKQGDTMWGISKKHGIGLNQLLAANPQITNSGFILPGQSINIPSTPTTPTVPSAPSTPSAPSDISALENEVIRLVNVERSRAGRPPLTPNSELSSIARIKSNDFVNNNYFSHTSPTYGTPFDMLRSFGVSFTAAAENIASGQKTAAEAMNTWMRSSGHRANILSSTYNQIGVGVARDNRGNLYWTQLFIRS